MPIAFRLAPFSLSPLSNNVALLRDKKKVTFFFLSNSLPYCAQWGDISIIITFFLLRQIAKGVLDVLLPFTFVFAIKKKKKEYNICHFLPLLFFFTFFFFNFLSVLIDLPTSLQLFTPANEANTTSPSNTYILHILIHTYSKCLYLVLYHYHLHLTSHVERQKEKAVLIFPYRADLTYIYLLSFCRSSSF